MAVKVVRPVGSPPWAVGDVVLALHLDKVQLFDGNGKFETQWDNLHRPNGMCMAAGPDPLFYIGEGGPYVPRNTTRASTAFTP